MLRRMMPILTAAMLLTLPAALGGCKKKGANCAKTAAKTGAACKECCKKAGAKGHSWVGVPKASCKCN